MKQQTRSIRNVTRVLFAALTIPAFGLSVALVQVPQAHAASQEELRQKIQSNENLKRQLSGVNQALSNQILSLNDLVSNQIPSAEQSLQDAQQKAEQAKSLAQATSERLDAAKRDKTELETKIKQSGIDFDDSKEAVAEMARKSFHGSEASDVMDVVTKSSTTEDFVSKMQSDAAITRSEANAAGENANTLNTAKNRKDRLDAIEDQITALKRQSDDQAASAQVAFENAQEKQRQLKSLLDQGNQERANLESQKGNLTSKSAKEAADIISLRQQITSMGGGGGSSATPDPSSGGSQQGGPGGTTPSDHHSTSGGGGASGMDYSVPGSCPEGSTFCYGHETGNTAGSEFYPDRQCTLWAYIRRSQLRLPVGSFMGNGADWAATGRTKGYLVNRTPHVGAVMVFARGQRVTNWNADWAYGHVAVVERVNSDGSVLISEGGTGFAAFPTPEIVYNAGAYEYVHY